MSTMTRGEALTRLTEKGAENTPDGARVYYTLLGSRLIPFEPKDAAKVRGGLNAAIHTAESFAPVAAHRTRKAFAALVETLLARGVLTQEELDAILLAAVGHQEPTAAGK